MLKKNKTKENKVDINNNLEDEHLKELKKAVDKSFKTKYTNKKKIATAALGLLGLATIGTVTPIIVSNANAKVDVTVKSSNTAMEKYKVEVKKGTKISKIKVVELEGYDFVGFFKDEACTKAYKSSDTLKKDTTIYASYKLKVAAVEYTVIVNGQAIKVPSFADITIGDVIKNIETLPYETSGVVYLDEACTLEADLNATMTSNTTLYTKAATLDKLSFTWNSATSSWSVAKANDSISGELVIPASYKDNIHNGSITAIEDYAFSYCSGLTSITIPNSVAIIYYGAFFYCSNLTSITVGDGNTNYHSSGNCLIETATKTLLKGCNTSVIPEDGSITVIKDYAFFNCSNLTTITIPNSVTTIEGSAFHGCSSLTSINVPNSVTTIEEHTFSGCSSLKSITIPNSVTSIGDYAFFNCSNLTTIIIPSSVTTIGNSAFSGCSGLTTITIPSSVTTMGDSAFSGCSGLTAITIPNSVKIIGYATFSYCSSLTTITIPNSVTTIGTSAFFNCNSLTSITIPSSVTTIGDSAFRYCKKLTTITIPNSVITIGEEVFDGCIGLTTITIPNSVTSIGKKAFSCCIGLTSITVEAGNTKYHSSGNCIIETASKTLVLGCKKSIIPTDGSVTTIEYGAFYQCSGLTEITIPNSVTTLGSYTFFLCSGLTSITIGNGVTTIGDSAFRICDALKTVIIDSATIANNLTSATANGYVVNYATTVYVKNGLDTSNSTYLTSNYTKQATTDKDGYDKWVKNS